MVNAGKSEDHSLLRAAQYVRMSTDHQRYSVANQSAAIAVYAAARNMVIVRSFVDAGKSGLHIRGRQALQDLIATVQSGRADFEYVLVYDVSRWGRFQDTDEAAYYEYLCKLAGIQVIYCAEQFQHENATINNLLKAMKRTMAGEYSRELSVKVFAAQSRIAKMGFHMGGAPPFGYRRLLTDPDGKPRYVLERGRQKALASDRVKLVLGSERDVRIVRTIFDLFTKAEKSKSQIAAVLNGRGLLRPGRKKWQFHNINDVLKNPKYTGKYIWARHTEMIGTKQRRTPEQRWIVIERAIPRIISPNQFNRAQALLHSRKPRTSESELLDNLRHIIQDHGKLSTDLLLKQRNRLGPYHYCRVFGSLANAYKLVGYQPRRDYDSVARHKARMAEQRQQLIARIQQHCRKIGATVHCENGPRVFHLNGFLAVAPVVVPFVYRSHRPVHFGWCFELSFAPQVDVIVAARLDEQNEVIESYYIVPKIAGFSGEFWMPRGTDIPFLEAYRSRNLVPLLETIVMYSLADLG